MVFFSKSPSCLITFDREISLWVDIARAFRHSIQVVFRAARPMRDQYQTKTKQRTNAWDCAFRSIAPSTIRAAMTTHRTPPSLFCAIKLSSIWSNWWAISDNWPGLKTFPCTRLFRACCPHNRACCRSWYIQYSTSSSFILASWCSCRWQYCKTGRFVFIPSLIISTFKP